MAWHRVWADDRPSRARRVPLRLSFLTDPGEMLRRRTLAWSTLDQFDHLVSSGHDVSNALAICALIAPFLADTVVAPTTRPGDANQAILEIGQPIVDQLRIARRDAERLRYILFALRKIAAARARNLPLDASSGRDSLEDAVQLAALLAAAQGGGAVATPGGGDADDGDGDGDGERSGPADPDAPEEPRKRRRRRRGGRRRHGQMSVNPASTLS
jgi:hypothetical protein